VKTQRRGIRKRWIAAGGVLIVAIVLIVISASAAPLAAGSLSPDSTTVDRLTAGQAQPPPASGMALAPSDGQKAAILAASLLLNPILSQLSLPVVIH